MDRLTIKSQLLLMLMVVGVAAVASVSSVAFVGSREALDDLAIQRVEGQHVVQLAEVERFLESLRTDLTVTASSRTTASAIRAFRTGLDGYAGVELTDAQQTAAVDQYLTDFATGGAGTVSEEVVALYRPDSPTSRALQQRWVIEPDGEPVASDGSVRYDRTHERLHGYFSDVADALDADDVMLVSLPDGIVVYSVGKRLDLGADVLNGGLVNSGIGEAVRGVVENPDRAHLIDFRRYRPATNEPSMFVAAPVESGEDLVGAIVARVGVEPFNRILTADRSYAEAGFGATGQSYLVGSDGLYRSQDRLLTERPEAAIEVAAAAGLNGEAIAELRRTGSPVLLLPADPKLLAPPGAPQTATSTDALPESVVATTGPVRVPDLEWTLVTEVSLEEARDGVTRLQRDLLVALMVLMVVIGVISVVAAQVLARPFKRLLAWAGTIQDDGAFDLAPAGGREFRSLVDIFHDLASAARMASDLADTEAEQALQTRTALLPKALAIALTEAHDTVEQYPEVVVATIRFLGAPGCPSAGLGGDGGGWRPQPLPADASIWLDDVIQRSERNQLRVVGLGEGLCQLALGLSEPRLNQERDLLDWLHRKVDERSDVVGGLASGDLSAAAVGVPPRFVEYWGPVITASAELARTAVNHGPGSVGLDERIAELLDHDAIVRTADGAAVVGVLR